ncbi:unnamed protein product [Hyaloperonospora brassicae]|uniref:Uncharacterized protein n=1 Tax=Hyaloperonospora brassicae TaxID=162125 RepID=A0AAV0UTH0_HYABA|nr:unnamed protein product [Hyaloperonospora brassicae]
MSPENQIEATEAKPIKSYSGEERGRSGGGGRGGFGRGGFSLGSSGRGRSDGGFWGGGHVPTKPWTGNVVPASLRSGEEEEEKVHSRRKGFKKLFDWF